jgi:hypothetical protein
MPKSELADIDYDEILLDDPQYKAILFKIGDDEVWIPRQYAEVDAGEKVVTIPEWLAIQKELV